MLLKYLTWISNYVAQSLPWEDDNCSANTKFTLLLGTRNLSTAIRTIFHRILSWDGHIQLSQPFKIYFTITVCSRLQLGLPRVAFLQKIPTKVLYTLKSNVPVYCLLCLFGEDGVLVTTRIHAFCDITWKLAPLTFWIQHPESFSRSAQYNQFNR
jgi:hypothetical protein